MEWASRINDAASLSKLHASLDVTSLACHDRFTNHAEVADVSETSPEDNAGRISFGSRFGPQRSSSLRQRGEPDPAVALATMMDGLAAKGSMRSLFCPLDDCEDPDWEEELEDMVCWKSVMQREGSRVSDDLQRDGSHTRAAEGGAPRQPEADNLSKPQQKTALRAKMRHVSMRARRALAGLATSCVSSECQDVKRELLAGILPGDASVAKLRQSEAVWAWA